ncbi:MAG: HEAT repeat domain-containing protein [Acidobacteriota bacterium]
MLRWGAGLPVLLALSACAGGTGDRPEAVREVVERAAAARDAGDFEAFVRCFAGPRAGRYREELQTVHAGDPRAFFANRRSMVVTGPVELRRRSFATVRIFVIEGTGFKPYQQVAVVFQDGQWLIDSPVPGEKESPRIARADPAAVVRLLEQAAAADRAAGGDGVFRRVQILRAQQVVQARRLEAAVPALVNLLGGDPDAGIRQFSALILGQLGSPEAVSALLEALGDPDLRVRGDAARALGRLDRGRARERLIDLSRSDPSPWVRTQAERALRGAAGAREEDPPTRPPASAPAPPPDR